MNIRGLIDSITLALHAVGKQVYHPMEGRVVSVIMLTTVLRNALTLRHERVKITSHKMITGGHIRHTSTKSLWSGA